tara:strand:- start:4304 stop:4768 length:465 start_codon:yes stop_codon:yes gene_type:complete
MKSKKYEKVMKYLVDNPTAKPSDIAKACKCSVKYVYNIRSKVGTPKEVFEKEERQKQRKALVNRTSVLMTANDMVSKVRQHDHGDFANNATMIAQYWNTHLGLIDFIKPSDVPIMLVLLKIARISENPSHIDNYVDTCGYSALAAEMSEDRSDT